jgi:hypothetical protein
MTIRSTRVERNKSQLDGVVGDILGCCAWNKFMYTFSLDILKVILLFLLLQGSSCSNSHKIHCHCH